MAGRKGAIAFGLVYIPVELFAATQDDAVRFNQLAKDSMKRVRYVKTCPDCKRELGPDDIVKGYQYEKGKYVVVTDEELESIKSEADRSMKIVQFADADEISPIFFEKPYQIVAQPGGETRARTAAPGHAGREQGGHRHHGAGELRNARRASCRTATTWS